MITHKLPIFERGGVRIDPYNSSNKSLFSVPSGWMARLYFSDHNLRSNTDQIWMFPFYGNPLPVPTLRKYVEVIPCEDNKIGYDLSYYGNNVRTEVYVSEHGTTNNQDEMWKFKPQEDFRVEELPALYPDNEIGGKIKHLGEVIMQMTGIKDKGFVLSGKGKTVGFSFPTLEKVKISHDGTTIAVVTDTDFVILDNPLL